MSEDSAEESEHCPVCGEMYTTVSEPEADDIDESDASVCEDEDGVYVHGHDVSSHG